MSLILDALRKSEAERRRGEAPSLYSSLPRPGTQHRPGWLRAAPFVVVAVLLLVTALVYFGRDERRAAPVEVERPAIASQVEYARAPAAPVPDAPAVAPVAAGTPPPVPRAPGTPVQPAPGEPATPAAPAIAAPAPAPATEHSETTSVAPAEEALPPLAVLEPSARTALPPLKLSMHVYNSEPARRFAIIDGQRVTEGAQLGAAVVTEIRRDGVVLDVGGRRVLVPRP